MARALIRWSIAGAALIGCGEPDAAPAMGGVELGVDAGELPDAMVGPMSDAIADAIMDVMVEAAPDAMPDLMAVDVPDAMLDAMAGADADVPDADRSDAAGIDLPDARPIDAYIVDASPSVELVCTDLIDDDVDGLIDCQDPDCADAQPCQPELCFNGLDEDLDGDVDCQDEECWFVDGCDGPPPFSRAEVQVVFNQRCGCHTGAVMLGGLTLVDPFTETTLGVRSRLPGVDRELLVPGDRAASFLYIKLTPDLQPEEGERMPPEQPFLDDIRIERIGRWIDALE